MPYDARRDETPGKQCGHLQTLLTLRVSLPTYQGASWISFSILQRCRQLVTRYR